MAHKEGNMKAAEMDSTHRSPHTSALEDRRARQRAWLAWRAPLALLACVATTTVHAASPAPVFADNMVLQRERPIPIFGTGTNGESVQVSFRSQTKTTTVVNGKWRVDLAPEAAGGPHSISITGANSTVVVVRNVMVGEVWLVMGQSNAEWNSNSTNPGEGVSTDTKPMAEQAASYPNIRTAVTQQTHYETLQSETRFRQEYTTWSGGNVAAAASFSAVGYSFGRDLQAELGVPIGLVQIAEGATDIELFMGPAASSYDADVMFQTNRYTTRKSAIYNGQIGPLAPFSFRGVIWYQGEANQSYDYWYRRELYAMIKEWRQLWNDPLLPVMVVQLPGMINSEFHFLRDAQINVANVLPNVGSVVTFDNSNKQYIHPTQKRYIGRRVAQWALADVYGRPAYIPAKPSYFKDASFSGNTATVSFSNVGTGLYTADGAAPKGFKLAGVDGVYHDATSVSIAGATTVVLSSGNVASPVNVRYAFTTAADVNLLNGGGHPVSAFRTDKAANYTEPSGSDRVPPTRPGNLQIAASGSNWLLTWSGSTDASGVEEHVVYADGFVVGNSTSNSVVLSNLRAGQELWVRAKDHVMNLSGKSNSVVVGAVGGDTTPTSPTGVTAVAVSSSTVNVAWADNAGNETAYHVERAPSSAGPWTVMTLSLPANTTSYAATGLTPSTAYWFRVRAANTLMSSYASSATAVTTPAAPPPPPPPVTVAAPSNLVATAVSSTQVRLNWIDNSNNETGFAIERSSGGAFAQIASAAANATVYLDATPSAATAYSYRVKASNAQASSVYSTVASITTPAHTTNPTADSSAFSFESSVQGWGNVWGVAGISAVALSSEQKFLGSNSLKITYANSSTTTQYPSTLVLDPAGLAAGKVITFRYFVPANSPINQIAVFIQTSAVPWTSRWATPVKGSWNSVSLTVPAGTVADIGFQVELLPGASGAVYVDSVTW
jgi:sialate O-acetylesterase